MGRIIGIDLGTTTSEIAFIKNGKPEIIVNDLGARITSSVVGLNDDNEVIVGITAKRQAVLKPKRTVMEVKRLMGTDKKVLLGNKEYLPQQISAMILKNLKRYAEDYLGEEVSEAVITIPANFNNSQRQATQKAGEMAGFRVERIINEPTAAALAYGINNLEGEENVLVYDLGGGTFDVTVLELFNGILDVKASRGDNELGGKDFDERILNYILKDFKVKHGIDLSGNMKTMARLKEAAEIAKIELSSMESTVIELPFIALDKDQNPLEINFKLTRNKFEELIKDLIDLTEDKIEEALKASGYNAEEIDIVLAVGGSSRIPCVKKMLSSKFKNKIKGGLNPDEAVALGAAVQAGIKNDEISSENSIIITDTCNQTLGVSVAVEVGNGRMLSGVFDPLIMKDSKIPCTEKKTYTTLYDNQNSVNIEVYQGDGNFVAENIKIAEVELDGIPNGTSGEEGVEISFTYNLNATLEVDARILSTGKSVKKIVNTLSNSGDILQVFNEVTVDNNLEQWKESELASMVKNTIELCEKKLEKIYGSKKIEIISLLNKLKKAVIDCDENLVEEYDDKLTDMLFNIC